MVQLWTGAFALAALEVVIVLPYRLWKAIRAEIKSLEGRLAPPRVISIVTLITPRRKAGSTSLESAKR
jgi:hypothetical protein